MEGSYVSRQWINIPFPICSSIFAAFLGIIVYRLLLHPLASFPGPKLAACFDLWELYQDAFSKTSMRSKLDELHNQYGPIVRVRPNEIHVKDPQWMSIFFAGPGIARDRDPKISPTLGTPLATIGTIDHYLHSKRRAAVSPLFSKRSIRAIEHKLERGVERVVRVFKAATRDGKILDTRAYFLAWAHDFMYSQMIGQDSNLVDDEQAAKELLGIYSTFHRAFPFIKQFHLLISIPMRLPKKVAKLAAPYLGLGKFVVIGKDLEIPATHSYNTYMAQDPDNVKDTEKYREDTIFDIIMASSLPLSEKRPERMVHEAFNILVAGSVTTSKTATTILYHLLSDEHIKKRIVEELNQKIPDTDSFPDTTTLETFPILNAAINEGLRIGGIVSTRSPLISPQKPLKYGNWIIPPGTAVSMTLSKTLVDPNIFPNPEAFILDRWLDREAANSEFNRYFFPFGRGTRMCLGMNLATAQLYMLFSRLFRLFDLELFDTDFERDVNFTTGGPLGEPSRGAKGVRVRVKQLAAEA